MDANQLLEEEMAETRAPASLMELAGLETPTHPDPPRRRPPPAPAAGAERSRRARSTPTEADSFPKPRT